MAKGFSISLDITAECERVAASFREYGKEALPRAAQFAANGVAIDAVRRFRERLPTSLDRPTGKTVDGPSYQLDKKSLPTITSTGEVRVAVYINPLQSIWMKYLLGDGTNRREPGDVGLSER